MRKGHQCELASFEDHEGLFIRISRGSYLKTIARWRGNEIEFDTFRPASEDIVVYEPLRSRLNVKCNARRDREQYVRGFAEFVAGNTDLAEEALNLPVFSLGPIRDGSFDYGGSGPISRISLVEAHIQLHCLGEPTVAIKSDNVLRTLAEDIPHLSLQSGDLVKVKMRFELRLESDRRPREVAFEIEPPGYSDLPQRAYARVIESHLREQRVKLI